MSAFQQKFYGFLPGVPTSDQVDLVERMERFLFQNAERAGFIIRGYAGTGKTTAIAAMIKTFPSFQLKSVLLAPTGRAAKVLSNFSKKPSYTIHKKIYQSERGKDGQTHFKLGANLHTNTIFIIDEASMISDGGAYEQSLLDDLIEYVFSGKNCRLVFIGDIAQLPPVGKLLSPALDPKYLMSNYYLKLKGVELSQVMRQSLESGILHNATLIRNQTQEKRPVLKFDLDGFDDVKRIDGLELEDELHTCFSKYGADDTIVITRSNKRANIFNQQIRVRIKDLDNEIATGDYLMVVKNNYYWLDEKSPVSFVANGDVAEVMGMGNIEELYGFRFLNASVRLIDYPQLQPIDVKLLLDSIHSEAPSLTKEDSQRLFETVMEDYVEIPNKRIKMELMKQNPYFNALQVKFGYAVTCHKSQGGQWKAVFVDQGYLTEEMLDTEYARWLYTAVTRATERLYLVNFNDQFFD
ncbi:AAA family ATPase [Vicingaceae bacterium]|nr:AAA family ATPase [Vicingaceae bacterium]MDB4060777.1 AAA family ATPase [Vicingaceae bacterium]MDB4082646.1 AAA family ATPase [Vicingaceae bacterium]